jgi:biopolymer transport protein ExbB
MKLLLQVLALLLAAINTSHADSFDELLKTVKQQTSNELKEESARINKFLAEKDQQQQLLAEAKNQLQALKKQSSLLKDEIEKNEKELTAIEETLQIKLGDLGELFGVVRQVSGELKADFSRSIVSAQYPQRLPFLDELAQSKALPDVKALEQLWFYMLQEMGETGKTREFNADVYDTDGTQLQQQVIRVGAYALLANGMYLQHDSDTNELHQLQKQPPARYRQAAQDFITGEKSLAAITIDPTHGQLLSLLTLKPTYMQRINQGGVVGYIILALGGIGLLIAVFRFFYLNIVSEKIKNQIKNLDKPVDSNPIGRIALVYREYQDRPLNEREIALQEAMIKEAPALERYNGLIKLLAAVTPLLGLLGTVIGMIITFQTITLFGTSDPKLMAGGISTALVTTVLGLSMAVPLLFVHTFIVAKSRRILDIIEHQSVGLIAAEK